MQTPEVITDVVQKFRSRLEELKPRYEEYVHLQEVVKAIRSASGASAGMTPSGRAPRGSRAQEALAAIRAAGSEGVTVTELASQLDVKANYLYRVTAKMVEDGKVRKIDKRYVAD